MTLILIIPNNSDHPELSLGIHHAPNKFLKNKNCSLLFIFRIEMMLFCRKHKQKNLRSGQTEGFLTDDMKMSPIKGYFIEPSCDLQHKNIGSTYFQHQSGVSLSGFALAFAIIKAATGIITNMTDAPISSAALGYPS